MTMICLVVKRFALTDWDELRMDEPAACSHECCARKRAHLCLHCFPSRRLATYVKRVVINCNLQRREYLLLDILGR